MADKVIYWSKTALTGGAAGALDSIDGTALQDGEIAHVWISNVLYIYLLDVDSGAAESSPAIIAPDTNAGDKRWILQSYYSGSGTLYTDHIAESTAAHGVEIDGLTIKDSGFAIGSDANGDMYYRASGKLARLAKGTAYKHLGVNSGATAPEWQASANSVLTAAGDILYASGANTLARLAKGSALALLRMNSGATAPEWGSAGQIVFPATQNASSNPNTLDDYEEGTWTPIIKFGGNAVGQTYNTGITNGQYVKIGRFVFVTCYIVFTETGSSTGDAAITGLPFTVGQYSSISSPYISGVTYSGYVSGYGVKGNTTIALVQIVEAGNIANLTHANFTDAAQVMCSLFYITSA